MLVWVDGFLWPFLLLCGGDDVKIAAVRQKNDVTACSDTYLLGKQVNVDKKDKFAATVPYGGVYHMGCIHSSFSCEFNQYVHL